MFTRVRSRLILERDANGREWMAISGFGDGFIRLP